MARAGLPIPGGFHVTTEAYRRHVSEFRDEIDPGDPEGTKELFARHDIPVFLLRPAGWAWGVAVRAGGCVGALGWWADGIEAGLTPRIGALTVLYGAGRPHLQPARQLAVIALALTAIVVLGTWYEGFGGHRPSPPSPPTLLMTSSPSPSASVEGDEHLPRRAQRGTLLRSTAGQPGEGGTGGR